MAELADLYAKMCDDLGRHVKEISEAQWEETTYCCPDWSVRDLVNHLVGENKWIPPLLGGKTIVEVGNEFDGDLLGDDPKATWTESARDAVRAIRQEDALDRMVDLSSGPSSGYQYISEVLSDQIVHTWDLATSIGTDARLDPELVEFALATLEPLAETWRAAGVLGARVETGESGDPQTQLLGLLGRRSPNQ